MTRKKLFERTNPVIKLLILILVTIIASLDFYPFLSGLLIVLMVILAPRLSSYSLGDILKSIKVFIGMAFSFMLIITITRYLSGEELNIVLTLGLGFRIILVSLYSSVFVKTTDPNELVISLIKYLKVPEKHGFAFLSAYRFLPTFKEELNLIKYSYQVRGIEESKNPFKQIWNSKRYIIPMLLTAIRKGTRVSMAMEVRAFGKYDKRTYYRDSFIDREDIVLAILSIAFIFLAFYFLRKNGLTHFSLLYND